jgi:hypothetical protein
LVLAMVALLSCSSKQSQVPDGVALPPSGASAGVQGDSGASAPALTKCLVETNLRDLDTGVGSKAPEITVQSGAGWCSQVTDALLQDVIGRFRLTTFPELEAVPVSVEVQPRNLGEGLVRFALRPTAALLDRWYALEASPFPENVAWADSSIDWWRFRDSDGRLRLRFRPGSAPLVRTIGFSERLGPSILFTIEFTETVRVVDASPVRFTNADASRADARCELSPLSPLSGELRSFVSGSCAALDTQGLVRVALSGLRTLSDQALSLATPFPYAAQAVSGGFEFTMDYRTLVSAGEGLKMFFPGWADRYTTPLYAPAARD